MSEELVRYHAIIHGRVQGVSFRYSTQQRAASLGVTGWVRNRSDGTVEVLGEGTSEQIRQFINFLRVGPPGARVDSVDERGGSATGQFGSFNIRYSM